MPSTIAIIVPIFQPDHRFLQEALHSVFHQTRPADELVLVLDGLQPANVRRVIEALPMPTATNVRVAQLEQHCGISKATNRGVQAAKSAYIGFLDHDDLLEPDALAHVLTAIDNAEYPPDLLYTDHDKIDVNGRRYEPEFKPDWSPETLLSHCYIGHFKVVRRDIFLELGGFRKEYDGAQDYDFLLRLADRTAAVLHIPHTLYHWRSTPGSIAASADTKPESIERGRCAAQDALRRRSRRGTVTVPPFAHQRNIGVYSLTFDPHDFTEKVTIVIPTKDRLDLLEPCIRSIRAHTTYPHYEILVVNNGEANRRLTGFLEQEGVRRLDITMEEFNFSHLINRAVEHVQTPFMLLLNDDTEILSGEWLLQMAGVLLLDERIGAVGAKLLFPDRHTQHSGVILGLHDLTAGHANRWLPHDNAGYRNSNRALRNYAAVTAACMLTRTSLFRDVGGFDEENFPVGYNDVDYCLKLLAKGFRIVQTPDTLLRHHQSASRGKMFHPDAEYGSRRELRCRWLPILRLDPYYNPNLSRHDEHFCVRTHPPGRRILFASHNLAYEGASLSLFELAIALKKRDYHIEVAAPKQGPLADAYRERNIPLHIGNAEEPHPLLRLNRDVFDILFLNTITLAPLLDSEDIAAHLTILCIHESERDVYAKNLQKFSEQLFSKVTRALFIADATRAVYSDLDRGHFRTIHNGINCAGIDATSRNIHRSAVRHALGIPDTDTIIVAVGTVCPRKGQRVVVDAAIHLLRSHDGLRFILVGGGTGSSYEAEVERAIRRSGFSDLMQIIPSTPDIGRFYAASDIFVCASSIESFPRVILEAMAWRLPIVATDIFGIPEQVRDSQEALLVPPENPAALAHALSRLIEDNVLRATLAKNARARVEKDFSIDKMIDQYEELFREVSAFTEKPHSAAPYTTSQVSALLPDTAAATRRGRGEATTVR